MSTNRTCNISIEVIENGKTYNGSYSYNRTKAVTIDTIIVNGTLTLDTADGNLIIIPEGVLKSSIITISNKV